MSDVSKTTWKAVLTCIVSFLGALVGAIFG